MAAEVSPGEYKDVVLFLATAGVVVPLFRRWNVSPILGFLLAGVVLGPFGLGSLTDQFPWLRYFTIDNPAEIAQLAEFGVVFLLFMIGLELSWERLRAMRRLVFGLGSLQVASSMAVIGGVAWVLGQPPAAAATIGAALALSSTAIVMPILTEHKRQHSQAGRATFSVLLLQDLAVAPILITLAVIARQDGDVISPRLLLAFAPSAAAVFLLVFLGRLLLRPMLKSVARSKSGELFMAACLLVVIGAGLISSLAGLSMALGAFIAGLLLAETEYRREVEVTIEPFKGLLLGLFFVSVGIGLNLSVVFSEPVVILTMALGIIGLTLVTVFALARMFGLKNRPAIETALLLAGAGEFAFVILGTAMEGDIVERPIGQLILVAVTVSMFCIPLLAWLGARLGGRAAVQTGPAAEPPGAHNVEMERVIVVGYGRVGKLVGEMLTRHEIPWTAIERDARIVETARRSGHLVYFGEADRGDFLVRCGLEDARALVITMDSPEGAEAVVATARELRPDLTIVARARDARHARRLYDLGATDAVPETIEASLQLSEATLVELGVPMGLVIASIHERRDQYRTELNRPEALGGRARVFRDAGRR